MGDVVLRTLAYALFAAASPVALLAALAVLTSGRGRAKGIALLGGVLLGQTAAIVVGLFVSSAAVARLEHSKGTLADALKLGLGVLLLAVAARRRRPATAAAAAAPDPPSRVESRTTVLLGKVEGLGLATLFSAGVALGIGTKRLVITLVAATTISVADLAPDEETGLIALYVVLATLPVWVPVALYLLFGKRADEWALATKQWLTDNSERLTLYVTVALGLFLCVDGLARLTT